MAKIKFITKDKRERETIKEISDVQEYLDYCISKDRTILNVEYSVEERLDKLDGDIETIKTDIIK